MQLVTQKGEEEEIVTESQFYTETACHRYREGEGWSERKMRVMHTERVTDTKRGRKRGGVRGSRG